MGESKGVSTLVAAVLILAITLTIGLLASDFFTGTITGITGKTTNDTQRVSSASNYNIEIVDTRHNEINDSLEVTLRNRAENIGGDIVLSAYCVDHIPYQKTLGGGLSKGEVERYTMSVPDCDVNHVRAELKNYPVRVEIEGADIEAIDFLNWRQALETDFESVNKSSNNLKFLSSAIELSQPELSEEESAGSFSGAKTNLTTSGGYLKLESP